MQKGDQDTHTHTHAARAGKLKWIMDIPLLPPTSPLKRGKRRKGCRGVLKKKGVRSGSWINRRKRYPGKV